MSHHALTPAAVAAAALLAFPALAQQPASPAAAPPAAGTDPAQTVASFVGRDGNPAGTANLTAAASGGVLLNIEVEGLPAGQWLGFHIHEGGVCDSADAFESAGGHFDPEDRAHGYYAEGGPHAGDMPNQFVPDSGVLTAEVFNHMVSLDEGDPASIRGRTLMIHEHQDDYESQPTGEAGGRLACAVIE